MKNSILAKAGCVNLVVSVAAEKDGQFLLVEEAKKDIKGLWNFPSGKMEWNENVIEAARREFLEETGYEVELTGMIGVYQYGWGEEQGVTVRFNFYGQIIEGEQKELAKDVSDTKWFSREDLIELEKGDKVRFGGTRLMIRDILAGKRTSLDFLATTTGPSEDLL